MKDCLLESVNEDSGVGEDRKQDEAGGGKSTGKAGTGRERGMISFLESRRVRVQSRLPIVRGRVVRQRGVMEPPHAGNVEMVEATEVERGEKRRSF